MDHEEPATERRRTGNPMIAAVSGIVRFVLPLAILGGAFLLAQHLLDTGPKANRRKAERRARLVEVVTARRGSVDVVVPAMGTVVPAREVRLRPRVSGEIVGIADDLVPGARFAEGDVLFRIDPTDYELAVRRRESELKKVTADLEIERGNQAIALREAELLGEPASGEDRALLLREPQLDTVKAAVDAAETNLEAAKLDLARTTVRAPFNAMVRERMVDRGAQVGSTTDLVGLVGTDAYWVEVSVPVGRLRWIRVPRESGETGSAVRVFDESAWGEGQHRAGRIESLVSELEPEGRMARLLVTVHDPLGLESDAPALLLGAYVRVEMDGGTLDDVVPVDDRLVRDGDRVWVMSDEDTLEIRKVEIAFRERDRVFVSRGIEDGERLVVSELSSPVPGLLLRVIDDETPASEATR